AAAPSKVPATAPLVALREAAWLGVTPATCSRAYWRQTKSSVRNWSKPLLLPGNTNTLGPSGMVAQPLVNMNMPTASRLNCPLMVFLSRLLLWGMGNLPDPSARASLDIGIITLGLAAVIPVVPGPLIVRRSGPFDVLRRGRR